MVPVESVNVPVTFNVAKEDKKPLVIVNVGVVNVP